MHTCYTGGRRSASNPLWEIETDMVHATMQCTDVRSSWKQATLLKHQFPRRVWGGEGCTPWLHWRKEIRPQGSGICPQHVLHAAFAECMIRCSVQKTPCVCHFVHIRECDHLSSASQLMRKDGYAEESLIAHEVHKYVAGHDVGEEELTRSACLHRLSLRKLRYLSIYSGCARSLHSDLSSSSTWCHSARSLGGRRPPIACARSCF